jgi:hypothetical protein
MEVILSVHSTELISFSDVWECRYFTVCSIKICMSTDCCIYVTTFQNHIFFSHYLLSPDTQFIHFICLGPWDPGLGAFFNVTAFVMHQSVCVSGSLLSGEAAITEIVVYQYFTNIRGLKCAAATKCHFILGLL